MENLGETIDGGSAYRFSHRCLLVARQTHASAAIALGTGGGTDAGNHCRAATGRSSEG